MLWMCVVNMWYMRDVDQSGQNTNDCNKFKGKAIDNLYKDMLRRIHDCVVHEVAVLLND